MEEPLSPDQVFIRKLTDIVIANLENENFGVNELAKASGRSLYRLGRTLHSINGKTVNQFIREVRLRKALEILRDDEYTVTEVANRVGFSSPAYFNHCFHKFFGFPPGEVNKIHIKNDVQNNPLESAIGKNLKVAISKRLVFGTRGTLTFILIIGALSVYIYKKTHKSDWTDDFASSNGRISIAVLPFRNMTRDTTWNVWQEGIQQTIISSLSNSKELKVIRKGDVETMLQKQGVTNFTIITSVLAEELSRSLNANFFVSGSMKQSGPKIRIDAQLISVKRSEVLHSFEVNGQYKDEIILDLTDTLRKEITDFLLLSKLIKEDPWLHLPQTPGTVSPEAFKYCIYGRKAYAKADWATAQNWFFRSLAADSNYIEAMSGIYSTYKNQNMPEQSLSWILKIQGKKGRMTIFDKLYYSWIYADNFEPPDTCIRYLKQLQAVDDQNDYNYLIGAVYGKSGQYDKAIPPFEKYLDNSRNKGKEYLKNNWVFPALGEVYHSAGLYKKERKLYRQAERYNDDQTSVFFSWVLKDIASLYLTAGDTAKANRYIQKYITVIKDNSSSDADITTALAWIYWRGGNQDKAEKYFRKALMMEPENPARMNTLANRLIDRNKDFDEALGLIDKALELTQNKYLYYYYLDTKGWVLYKQGNSHAALELFQNLWDTTPYKMYIFKSHLDEVKRTITAKGFVSKS